MICSLYGASTCFGVVVREHSASDGLRVRSVLRGDAFSSCVLGGGFVPRICIYLFDAGRFGGGMECVCVGDGLGDLGPWEVSRARTAVVRVGLGSSAAPRG